MNLLGQETNGNVNPNSWKAIWSGPGSTFSKVTAVFAVGGLAYGFVKALPWLIAAASNTLFFIGECALIVLLLSLFTSKSFWKCISVGWRILTKKILGAFVKIDPISSLENGIAELREQLETVEENVTKLGGVLEEMKGNLAKYKHEFQTCVRRRDAAKKLMEQEGLSPEKQMEIKSGYLVTCNDIARYETLIKNQQKRIDVAEKYNAVMKRLSVMAKFKVKDAESTLRFQKEEYKAAKAQLSAIGSIKAIMKGQVGGLDYDLALEHVNDTVYQATAQMRELLDGSNDLLVNFDLDTYANLDKVDEIVTRFEKFGFDSFQTEGQSNVVDVPYSEKAPEQITAGNTQYMSDLVVKKPEPEKIPDTRRYF